MSAHNSIIIRTLNEEQHLGPLLQRLNEQNVRDPEIIVVDSGSTDRTLEIAAKFTSMVLHLRPDEFTFGRALNLGCRQATGEILVFVSAHTLPLDNNWLANLTRPFEDPTIGMVYGRQQGTATTRLAEERDFEQEMFGPASKILVDGAYGHNGNAAVRRVLWLDQPFDESLPGLEDIAWAKRAQASGFRIYYSADARIAHIHNENLGQIYRRYKREGLAYRMIYPRARYRWGRLIKNFCFLTLKDVMYGMQRRKSLGTLLEVVPTRLAEVLGTYRGMNGHEWLPHQYLPQPAETSANLGVVIRSSGQHRLEERPMPEIGDDDVLVAVAYVGVCATDLEVLKGELIYYQNRQAAFPIVPGHEYSGVVQEVGNHVHRLKRGDKVVGECVIGCGTCEYCRAEECFRCLSRREVGVINFDGAYSRLLKLPARAVHLVPRDLPLIQAALIEPTAVCLKGLRKLAVIPGRRACVVGAGPVGNLCAQILKNRGLHVAVMDRDPSRLRLIGRYGVDTWADLEHLDTFDYLVEASGNEAVLKEVIERSKPSAKILILGLPHVRPTEVAFSSVVCYDKEIYGSIGSAPSDWDEAITLVSRGVLELDDFTQKVFPLEQYEDAWRTHQTGNHLKVMISATPKLAAL